MLRMYEEFFIQPSYSLHTGENVFVLRIQMYECMKMYEEKIRTRKKKVLYGMEKNLHTFSYIHTLFNNNLSLNMFFFILQ